eukprot:CAMPEP_0179246836 /NCGR_PEP_ID=MMETSP0797-20121207/19299_1 /TAXON_ID=47934 /ORGANISM="Dinophysis acuminata, Strain DAEP01" /LENGTH=520 /DNA_ID=CAMNT_0020954437 /DNA_START=1 /DNA_END=1563 /DNA_ORIENTATION=-
MGCLQSVGQTSDTTVWKCQYCGAAFRTYEEADRHEKFQCSYKQSAGGMQAPAYAQNPYGNAVANQLAGGGGYKPGQHAAQPQQQPVHLKCGKCGQVMGVPPGHAQVICPRCGVVNACPQPQQPVATIPQQVYNQHLGQQPAAGVGEPGPPPTGRKRALLIGINYFGTRAELRGCINDVHRMRGLIMGMYGFPGSPDAMTILTDDSSSPQSKPTRANILGALRWLVQGAQPGDVLFLHFSGHGAQQEDPSYTEEDGYDETICPSDFQRAGMVVDDEIFDAIVLPLPPGVKLTAVMDCCHSGTGLDLPYTWQYSNWAEEDNPCHSAGDVILISGCQDEQTSSDGGGGYGKPMGAMTTALCNTLERNPTVTHVQMLDDLRKELRRGGFDQIPSLTSSQRFDARGKMFSPCDNIEGNSNTMLGRIFRKKKHAKRPGLLHGGLGEMLMAGAVGFIAADLLTSGMGGDLASGLVMGGTDMAMGGADMVADGAGGLMGGGGGLLGGFFGGGGDDGGGDMFGGFFGDD